MIGLIDMALPKSIAAIIPTGPQVAREAVIVLAGVLIAAFIISRFPALKKFVGDASITVNDANGNTYW